MEAKSTAKTIHVAVELGDGTGDKDPFALDREGVKEIIQRTDWECHCSQHGPQHSGQVGVWPGCWGSFPGRQSL